MVFCFAPPDYFRFEGNGGSIDGLAGREVSQAKVSGRDRGNGRQAGAVGKA